MSILGRERGTKAEERKYKCFYELDLYTGAHDKNYDEIFENDIVKYNDEYYAVVYKQCGFVLKKDLELPSIDYRLGNINYSKCKIVGTVYNDLKLLENNDTKHDKN